MTPKTSPASTRKETPRSTGVEMRGYRRDDRRQDCHSGKVGDGSALPTDLVETIAEPLHADPADTQLRHDDTACSKGKSSRARIMFVAIMLPLDAAPLTQRTRPRHAIPAVMRRRQAFVDAEKTLGRPRGVPQFVSI